MNQFPASLTPSRILLGTKDGHPDLASMDRARCTLAVLRRDFAESLDRLQVDRVGAYWLHRDHPGLPEGVALVCGGRGGRATLRRVRGRRCSGSC